jgi:preprotein translocase subunit SecE
MPHKSKTQRAKAAQAHKNRKDREIRDAKAAERAAQMKSEEPKKKKGFGKAKNEEETKPSNDNKQKSEEKAKEKPKKERFKFIKEVRAEMKRVTWPTRQDVIRWTGVVIFALVFFGVYVAILDNIIITPLLVGVTSLGA